MSSVHYREYNITEYTLIVFAYAIYTAYVYYALSLHLLCIYIFSQLLELLIDLRVVFL